MSVFIFMLLFFIILFLLLIVLSKEIREKLTNDGNSLIYSGPATTQQNIENKKKIKKANTVDLYNQLDVLNGKYLICNTDLNNTKSDLQKIHDKNTSETNGLTTTINNLNVQISLLKNNAKSNSDNKANKT